MRHLLPYAAALAVVLTASLAFAQTPVQVSPSTLVLGLDQGGAVTVHAAVPYGSVDRSTLTLTVGSAVFTPQATWADARGDLVARFSEAAVKAAVSPGQYVFTLQSSTFCGSDVVEVIRWQRPR